jgi:putative flippase GtrA
MKMAIQNKAEKIRFCLVGGANTAIDFGILLALTTLGVPAPIANYPSSTVAVIFSFFANKKYTFKATGKNLKKEIVLFLVFTLIAAWALQPLTILLAQSILSPFNLPVTVSVIIAKIAATVVSLVWNYFTYSRFVFAQEK